MGLRLLRKGGLGWGGSRGTEPTETADRGDVTEEWMGRQYSVGMGGGVRAGDRCVREAAASGARRGPGHA